jgi:hypothetical protein
MEFIPNKILFWRYEIYGEFMRIRQIIILIVFVFSFTTANNAQYDLNRHYAGASVGMSFLGSAGQFGLNYEYSLELKDFGNVGVGAIFRYWGYKENYPSGSWNYSNFVIGAQGNYHFKLNDSKFDPWAGIILAYNSSSVSWKGSNSSSLVTPSSGGLWLAANGGLRYWFNPEFAATGRITFGNLGYGSLDIGVDYKFSIIQTK